jgi:prepilin-type N-terminal cleavage/methylation domain-containing protein
MKRTRDNSRSAFTLLELLIVLVVLGILAAIVVPQYTGASQDAIGATLRSIIRTVQTRIDYEHHASASGSYPDTVEAAWFAGQVLPSHPENSFGVPAIEVVDDAGEMHPDNKVLKASVAGAFWYNAADGAFRARVADQGSAAATLDFYNYVNQSNEAGLGNYAGGGAS